jgi:glycosyltransferase involved in cell wall biosynthesis
MSEREVNPDRFTVKAVAPADVASYLLSCDAGIAFYKPALSRLATSPIKVPEYLACGLPLIINAGVGDADSMVVEENVGALVRDFTKDEYAQAANTIENLLRDRESIRKRTRGVAERLFDVRKLGVERYARLYEAVFAAPGQDQRDQPAQVSRVYFGRL